MQTMTRELVRGLIRELEDEAAGVATRHGMRVIGRGR